MNTFRNGIPFSLKKNLIDLDSLIGKKSPAGTEAVLYNRFQADRDGVAQLGIGCDWWFEAYSNGIACTSTMESGNETNHFAPANNPFFLPVRKGENLLAIRVRRGSDSSAVEHHFHLDGGISPRIQNLSGMHISDFRHDESSSIESGKTTHR